ncbi:hypothetical protein GCM10028818_54670 [Spirosoma horti]
MKRTVSLNFLAIILAIGLVASLGVNVYQLYRHSALGLSYAEEAETDASQLLQQLSTCSQENTRKDSVIAVLQHRKPLTNFSTSSAQAGP